MTQTELVTKRLEEKTAIIIGGNSGIGLATTQQFFITVRRQNKLDKVVDAILFQI